MTFYDRFLLLRDSIATVVFGIFSYQIVTAVIFFQRLDSYGISNSGTRVQPERRFPVKSHHNTDTCRFSVFYFEKNNPLSFILFLYPFPFFFIFYPLSVILYPLSRTLSRVGSDVRLRSSSVRPRVLRRNR